MRGKLTRWPYRTSRVQSETTHTTQASVVATLVNIITKPGALRLLRKYARPATALSKTDVGRTYFIQATKGYRTHSCYKAELAWSLYGLSLTQRADGDEECADATLREAKAEYFEAVGEQLKDPIRNEMFETRVSLPAR